MEGSWRKEMYELITFKDFTETTYSNSADKKAMTTEAQEKKVNDFMVENADKITVNVFFTLCGCRRNPLQS